jgi:hypothetical protein
MRLPIPKFKVLLYGPGLPPVGIKAWAHFEDSVLVVQGKGHWFTIQGDRLFLKIGGYDGRQWLVCWETPSGQISMILKGSDAVEVFIKLAPTEIAQKLKQVYRAHVGKFRLGRLGWVLLIALVVLLIAIAYGVVRTMLNESGPQAVEPDIASRLQRVFAVFQK